MLYFRVPVQLISGGKQFNYDGNFLKAVKRTF